MVTTKPIEVFSQEEIETLLLKMWPDGVVTKKELFKQLDITIPLERNIISKHLGISVKLLRVRDIAKLFWELSNYGKKDD